MSDENLKSVSSASGIYPLPGNGAAPARSSTPRGGNARPAPGNPVPGAVTNEPDIEALVETLKVASQSIGRDLRFKVDMDSGRSVIQVLDRETGEIIREIPPEKAAFRLAFDGGIELSFTIA